MSYQVGFFQADNGSKSMGRLLVFMAQVAGVVVVTAGVIVFLVAFFAQAFEALGHAVTMTTVGIGVEAGSIALKNWGKHEERS